MMYTWGGPPWGRAKLPAAMTLVTYGGQQMLVEPLGNDDARRAELRGAFERILRARFLRAQRRGR